MGKKKVPVKAKSKDAKKPIPAEKSEKEDSFDFGGLPDRDLKKNLGCG